MLFNNPEETYKNIECDKHDSEKYLSEYIESQRIEDEDVETILMAMI